MIATLGVTMARKKTAKGRYEFQADQELLDRADARANELGLNLAAWIRLLISQELERVEQNKDAPKKTHRE